MRRPKHVDKELHAVISSCWNEDPLKRPTFKALQETLEKLERQQTGYINLQSFTDATYVNVDNAVRDKVRDEAIF
ncbi:tyrosine kinase receptor Cad96Ca-like [Orbicella faveolata]|uniref:tyrosine kinase receptor Cad96Ca-like n=1 Tax=Orbicella faveolata TaxID=48498 RepID=UPI0009E46F55|nr:tyrosine kinase receptor Cad96Ca-like [Orbicella faveolata]